MWTKETAGAYLAGMIDADGTVSLLPRRDVSITNTNRDIIHAVTTCLDIIGVTYSIYEIPMSDEKRSDIIRVYIGGQINLRILHDSVPLQCPDKYDRLNKIVHSYRLPLISQKGLADLYYVQKLSQRQIANQLGCYLGTVQLLMKKYGLQPRSREEAQKLRRSKLIHDS